MTHILTKKRELGHFEPFWQKKAAAADLAFFTDPPSFANSLSYIELWFQKIIKNIRHEDILGMVLAI
ncbi:MAG: hypothetical protein LBP71_06815 [Spirochaetaceae bacterium]|nr:hypothetical protein [Spirochaetaceae bacterium]